MADKEYIECEALIKQFDERYITAIKQENLQESEEGEILWRGIRLGTNWGRNTIIDAPAADVVEVTRCKDCKHCAKNINWHGRKYWGCHRSYVEVYEVEPTHYCSYGERKK